MINTPPEFGEYGVFIVIGYFLIDFRVLLRQEGVGGSPVTLSHPQDQSDSASYEVCPARQGGSRRQVTDSPVVHTTIALPNRKSVSRSTKGFGRLAQALGGHGRPVTQETVEVDGRGGVRSRFSAGVVGGVDDTTQGLFPFTRRREDSYPTSERILPGASVTGVSDT